MGPEFEFHVLLEWQQPMQFTYLQNSRAFRIQFYVDPLNGYYSRTNKNEEINSDTGIGFKMFAK